MVAFIVFEGSSDVFATSEEVTGVKIPKVPQTDATMAGSAYRHGYYMRNWWPGTGMSIIAKETGNSDLVREVTRAFYDEDEDKQFKCLPIPERK